MNRDNQNRTAIIGYSDSKLEYYILLREVDPEKTGSIENKVMSIRYTSNYHEIGSIVSNWIVNGI